MKHREKKPRKWRLAPPRATKEPKEHKRLELAVVLLTVVEVLLKIIKELLH